MKVVLTTLNAKYSHSSLALAYLSTYCQDERWQLQTREYTINDSHLNILTSLYELQADVLCFSCYIWNIDMIQRLISDIKKVQPHIFIILGGPEVSYDAADVIKDNPAVDLIIRGEGEQSLLEVLEALYYHNPLEPIPGITFYCNNRIINTVDRLPLTNLDSIPSPYENPDQLHYYNNRIIYYETSRGCPHNCSYCISSTIHSLRYFSLERVKQDLAFLIGQGVRQIKFVDRTFNANEDRAREIMQYVLSLPGETRFHFEIGAASLTPDMLAFLAQVAADRFDFEIGIQSTCEKTLQSINRKVNIEKLMHNIRRLQQETKIHLHVDLIAGLPYGNYEQFQISFNEVYSLKADVIQLGFLKMLKGTLIREQESLYNYQYQDKAPYQVLANKFINFTEMSWLLRIEELLDRYYNQGDYTCSLNYLASIIYSGNAFQFWEDFALYWQEGNLFSRSHRRETAYTIISNFVRAINPQRFPVFQEMLKFDYLNSGRPTVLPEGIYSHNPADDRERLYDFIKDRRFVQQYLPEFIELSPGEIRRRLYLEWMQINLGDFKYINQPRPVFFVYEAGRKRPIKIFQLD
ncbi:MAG: DUF4080 domain-containing protein [Syntrophomonadaceae bacterium]|nr:DUF4080 domain-containing protein [Syntrophomonadaceae bacterium]